jgi:hypothetical protein
MMIAYSFFFLSLYSSCQMVACTVSGRAIVNSGWTGTERLVCWALEDGVSSMWRAPSADFSGCRHEWTES